MYIVTYVCMCICISHSGVIIIILPENVTVCGDMTLSGEHLSVMYCNIDTRYIRMYHRLNYKCYIIHFIS